MSKHLTLSKNNVEADCKELSKLAKICTFLQILLDELKHVDLPRAIFEDNARVTFLARNL